MPYGVRFFHGNWAEQNPADWWNAVCLSTKKLLEGITKSDVLAISFSGQMMGCVCVDSSGNALRDAIIWADMRAVEQEKQLLQQVAMDRFYRITGHRASASYSIEKLMWIKDHEPEIYRSTYKMLHAKDFIVCQLTGNFVSDYSDASGTNAFDLNTFSWSEEIIQSAGVRRELFPEVVPSTHIAGTVTEKAAKLCGLLPGTPVVIGGGDGMCASVGAGSIEKGKTYNCLGSSSWISTTTKKPIFDPSYRTFNWAHVIPGLIGPTGTMQTAGAAFSWLKSEVCTKETADAELSGQSAYERINSQIELSQPGANGLLFLPYLLGERSPRWDPDAKGAFIGLKMEHRRADILRSVVEGIGMNLNIILQIFRSQMQIDEITMIGGMAKGKIVRQIFSDIYGLPVKPLNYLDEATSMGAAVTAGVGVGALDGFHQIEHFIKLSDGEQPNLNNTKLYQKLIRIFDQAYDGLKQVNTALSEWTDQ